MLSKVKYTLFFLIVLFSITKSNAQCFQIESILVDACSSSGPEGKNEMVRFKVGSSNINTSTMSVTWPNNGWQGLIQNATTATKVSQLNAQISSSGGCGTLIEPTGGVLPANAKVVLVTSFDFEVASNYFGAITENIYIIFQNNATTTAGHFANYNATPGIRTLTIDFGACTDTVSYDRSLLVNELGINTAADGATVNFTPAGVASYTNSGCLAPVEVSSIDAGSDITACQGSTISLSGTAVNASSYNWSAPSGVFTASGSLNTSFTLNPATTGTIVLTLSGSNTCSTLISDTVTINITSTITPTFSFATTLCASGTIPTLPTTSDNGITGTWSPSTITTSGNYTFTPNNPSQCGSSLVVAVTVNSSIAPTFSFATTLCTSGTIPTLPTTSDNGITGTWSPSTITTSGNYTFTPNNPSQCGSSLVVAVTVNSSIVPTFSIATTLCASGTIPTLPTTSNNGITGTWSPSTITTSGNYTFTPNNPAQCGSSLVVAVTVNSSIAPTFSFATTLCASGTIPTLPTTSNNGITGTWSPSTITTSGNYTFTPNNPAQCGSSLVVAVTVNSSIAPTFSFATTLCASGTIPTLPSTSNNGITGTWSPSTITTSGNYTFTPNNPAQCGSSLVVAVTVNSSIAPTFSFATTLCASGTIPTLPSTSDNGIIGTWSPSTITISGNYTFTPNNPSQCGSSLVVAVTVNSSIAPTFSFATTLCASGTIPTLPSTSDNGITGTWSPSTITTSGNYTFTPNNPSQCGSSLVVAVTVNSSIVPTFSFATTLCASGTIPTLPTTSDNGITGAWSPSTITTSGNYTFTPNNPSQCGSSLVVAVTVNSSIVPTFSFATTLCASGTIPALPSTSDNGITGTWSPSTITTSGNYTFTPNNPSQCGSSLVVAVTVNSSIAPTFSFATTLCASGTIPTLPSTSDNGITGAWSPSTITTSGNYTFTPNNPAQCAENIEIEITLNNCTIPKGISPNDDGNNDSWDLSKLNVKRAQIFNRYGMEVYSKVDYLDEWKGTTNSGDELPTATYYYLIELSTGEVKSGWVYVNRAN